jgi:molecular chaperone GrpE
VEEKDRPTADLDAGVPEDASDAGPVYDVDSDSPHPVDGEDQAAEPADKPAEAPVAGRPTFKMSRKDFLNRLTEKNSAITRLQREKTAFEKEKQAWENQRSEAAAEKAALEAQVKESTDRWMRSAAEFENYRKRTAKEWELLKQQTKTEVILEVLNSLDDFDRAFAVVDESSESEFVRGIRLIYNNLLQVLQKMGVGEVDALHQPFDPMSHMAIGQTENTDVASGHVVQVVQKGYALNGTVIRPAHVIVAK